MSGREKIKAYMEEHGVSVHDLEAKSGVMRETLRNIIAGRNRVTGDTALKLAPVMGVSPEDIADPKPARKVRAA
jgi:plasmid maintenance system antidote protein VapI